LTLTFEAYVANAPIPQRDLYTLECSGVKDVRLQFSPEFPADLNRPYDPEGHDQRANEIHELRWDISGYVRIAADMIQGSFYCQSCRKAIKTLEDNGHRYAVIGGIALSQWGVVRVT